MAQPAPPQVVPQPVVPAAPRVYTPSPTYDKYIPATPKPTSLNSDQPPKIYQFYKYVPAPAPAPAPVAPVPAFVVQTAPAFSLLSTSVQPVLSTVAARPFNIATVTPAVMPSYIFV